MLQLIYGRSGYGKTQYIREKIRETVEEGRRAILIVPEQFSFESERALYFLMGAKASIQVEVLSFTRLAHTVFREYGGTALRYVGDGGKHVLLSLALGELVDQLDIYKRSANSSGFIKGMARAISELKQSGVEPERLRAAVEEEQDGSLKQKASELALIYEAYNAMLERGYADTDDDLERALDLIQEHHFFRGTTVFLDEFKGLTATELKVAGAIIADADTVYAALCVDDEEDREDGMGVFSGVKRLARRMIRMAREAGIPVGSPTRLRHPWRFKRPELAQLERTLFSNTENKQRFNDNQVTITKASSIYSETEHLAARIKSLVREKGLRYRDIAVIGRDIEPYRNALERMMERYEIPTFYGIKEGVYMKPLPSLVLSLLKAAVKNYDNDSLFAALKTGLTPLPTEEIALLELYAYTWDIKGRVWEAEFTQNPQGFSEAFTEEDTLDLEQVNHARAYLIGPLKAFRERAGSMNGLDFTKALYDLLEELTIPGNYAGIAGQIGDKTLREEYVRLWEMFCEVLDELGELLKNTVLPLRRFTELLELMFDSLDMGEIPQNLDEILVGDASLVRPSSPEVVFILGANEGIFPLMPSSGGMFSDSERRRLKDLGLELTDTIDSQVIDEQFIAYKALTAPSSALYISYPTSDIKGVPLSPSALLKEIRDNLGIEEQLLHGDTGFLVQNEKSAYYALAKQYRRDTADRAALLNFFREREGYGEKIAALNSGAFTKEYRIQEGGVAKELFGEKMRLSPTRVERYFGCSFAYFVEYGLRVQKKRKAELSPLAIGSLIHYALQLLIQKYGGKGLIALTEDEIRREVQGILQDYIAEYMGGVKDKSKRFKYLYTRLSSTLIKLIRQLAKEFAQSAFEPADFEMKVGYGGEISPIEILLPEGGSVRVEGIIDRVDVMERRGEKYIRVVDYKTGGKDFKLSDVYYGLNMQMLLYLFSLWQNGGRRYGEVIPAGVLYMPAKADALNMPRESTEEDLEKERIKSFRMHGLVLDDPEIIRGMDAEAQGLFINVALDKSGQPKKAAAVASLSELGKLKVYTEKLLTQLAQELHHGAIPANPNRQGDKTACDWCQYRSICGHEDDEAFHDLKTIGQAEFFRKIEEEGENDETIS